MDAGAIYKRIIGLPGERIEIKDGYIFLNGKNLNDPFGGNKQMSFFLTDEDDNDLYEYNGIIPFARTGLQLNYGRFFINPFISFDLQQINFNKFSDILDTDIEEIIKNYTVRTGLEFGIMF